VSSEESWDDLAAYWGLLIPDTAGVKAIVALEKPGKITSKMQAQLDRYFEAYEELYKTVEKGLNAQKGFDTVSGLMRQLMELHPYQTYSWKTGKAASQGSIKGKGECQALKRWKETGDVSELMKLIDISRAKFNDKDAFKGFMEARLIMVGVDSDSIETILGKI
jgi:hypothetical protein